MIARRTLRRLHVWLGWLVGVPLLFCTASGPWMAARPIDEVRGTALRSDPVALALPEALGVPSSRAPMRSRTIEHQPGGAVWIVRFLDGSWRVAVYAVEAQKLARAAYRPATAIVGTSRMPVDAPPLDLRQPRPAWQVAFVDGIHVYVDAYSGLVLALRTRQWRAFDGMWGLHIMDLGGREATHHGVLVMFAALAVFATLLALVLLPISGRRR